MSRILTASRARKRAVSCVIAALLVFTVVISAAVPAEAEEASSEVISHSKAGILYEATTDTVLYEKNADMELPMASMTKVMTAILVLEKNPDLTGDLTVSDKAVSHYYCSSMEPQRHLKEGEIISYEECMKYLLIPSGNEAATAFAFDMCDSMSDFVDMMNDKAAELGCEHTHYLDPIGLSSDNHYTTPRDMVKIAEYAMSFDKFREIVRQKEGAVPASNVRDKGFDYYTTNYVMDPDDRYESPYADYVIGVKTGYTPAAGWCLTGCMEKDGLVWYSVVMGGEELQYDEERIVQGDFLDTISLYGLTDGITAEDLKKTSPLVYVAVIGAIAVIAAIVIVFVVKKKQKKT